MPDANQLEFVARLFPEVKRAQLKGLAARVTRLEVPKSTIVNLRQQAAMCLERGLLESGRRIGGVWSGKWATRPGTVFNTDALQRKRKGVGMHRALKRVTLLLLTPDDLEAELRENRALAAELKKGER